MTNLKSTRPNEDATELAALQRWAYLHIGSDPDVLEKGIDDRKYAYLGSPHEWTGRLDDDLKHQLTKEISLSEKERHLRDEVYRLYRTTRYQDPIILAPFGIVYDRVRALAESMEGGATSAPVIGTIPLTMLNGFAFEMESGKNAIVLQDGLRFLPQFLSAFVSDAIAQFTPQGVDVFHNAERIKNRFTEISEEKSDLFIGALFQDATNDGLIVLPPDVQQLLEQDQNRRTLVDFIRDGFMTFIIAHEYAHCVFRHTQIVKGASDIPTPMRNPDFVKEQLEKLQQEKYRSLGRVNETQLRNYSLLQALEIQADQFAFKLLLKYIAGIEGLRPQEAHLLMVGAFTFFAYSEQMERVLYAVQSGRLVDPNQNIDDIELENLCFRTSHPAPRSRANTIVELFQRDDDQDNYPDGNPVESAWRCADSVMTGYWEKSGAVLDGVLRRGSFSISNKWIDELPHKVSAIGFDGLRHLQYD